MYPIGYGPSTLPAVRKQKRHEFGSSGRSTRRHRLRAPPAQHLRLGPSPSLHRAARAGVAHAVRRGLRCREHKTRPARGIGRQRRARRWAERQLDPGGPQRRGSLFCVLDRRRRMSIQPRPANPVSTSRRQLSMKRPCGSIQWLIERPVRLPPGSPVLDGTSPSDSMRSAHSRLCGLLGVGLPSLSCQ